ncbi:hypothetical protein SALBM135S_08617 [Streptomyces alboniger]
MPPVLLVGHSIGGVLAHAVAAHLERAGHEVAGAVLIDTYEPGQESSSEVFGWAMGRVIDRGEGHVDLDEAGVLAMGGYPRLLDDWAADPLTAPALLLTAERGPDAPGADGWRPWRAADTVTPVPGDHFSLLEDHAADAARTVEDWLGKELSCSTVGIVGFGSYLPEKVVGPEFFHDPDAPVDPLANAPLFKVPAARHHHVAPGERASDMIAKAAQPLSAGSERRPTSSDERTAPQPFMGTGAQAAPGSASIPSGSWTCTTGAAPRSCTCWSWPGRSWPTAPRAAR